MLFYLDILFNVAFTVEMLLKILAFGIFQPQHAYLRSRWNWIDVPLCCPRGSHRPRPIRHALERAECTAHCARSDL